MRALPFCLLPFLMACAQDPPTDNHQVPPLENISETPGDWSALSNLVGRVPAESGLIDNSPISIDLNSLLGPDLKAYRSAMMRSGPLTRQEDLLVARAPDAWLVLQPGDHAFRAALRTPSGWREWQTPGAEVPKPD